MKDLEGSKMNINKWKSQFEKATFYMIPIL